MEGPTGPSIFRKEDPSDRLDQARRGLGSLTFVEDLVSLAAGLQDDLPQRVDDLVETRTNRRVGDARLLGDRLQVAAGENEHLDEALVLHWEPREARGREVGLDGDLARWAGHASNLHGPLAVRAMIGNWFRWHVFGLLVFPAKKSTFVLGWSQPRPLQRPGEILTPLVSF